MSDGKRGYINGHDIQNWLNNLDYAERLKPIAISEKVSGLTKDYFSDEKIVYAVRIAAHLERDKDFDGWVFEGLTREEILKYNKGRFG